MEALLDEVESLEAILMDDVKITKNESGFPDLIETTIFPTVGEDVDSQYVCVTLQVMPILGYPDEKPNFKLKNPRGLDDNVINLLDREVKLKLEECLGQPVVFDLIDIIREHLTESNLPTGQCVICLYGFLDGDQFTKTVCYHYLHSHCLSCHIIASQHNYEEELVKMPIWKQKEAKPFQALCPVCRDPINVEVEPLLKAKPPHELQNAPSFILTAELKNLQAQMNRLYLHQKRRGGIIDLDAEESNIISIESEDANNETAKSTNEDNVERVVSESNGVQHHDRGNNSRHMNRGINRHQNNVAPVVSDAGVAAAVHKDNSHKGGHYGHRNKRDYHHGRHGGRHHHHHNNYHNDNSNTSSSTETSTQNNNDSNSKSSQKHANNPCGSNAR